MTFETQTKLVPFLSDEEDKTLNKASQILMAIYQKAKDNKCGIVKTDSCNYDVSDLKDLANDILDLTYIVEISD